MGKYVWKKKRERRRGGGGGKGGGKGGGGPRESVSLKLCDGGGLTFI